MTCHKSVPATSACPLCGGELKHPELRFHRNIVFCDSGAVALAPTQLTVTKSLARNPAGLEASQISEASGLTTRATQRAIIRLDRKLSDIGWHIRNAGCPGGSLYLLERKW